MGLRPSKRDNVFFDLLTSSAKQLVLGVDLLARIIASPKDQRVALRDELHEIEHQADEITHAISQKLNQTFVTPLDRDDIQLLASKLDDCMDYIDEAGDLIVLYNIDEIVVDLTTQVDVLQRCAELTAAAMPGLRTLEDLRDFWVEINRLENEGDQAYRRLLGRLFDSGYKAPMIIKFKDIIESLERGVDSFEEMATVIETIAIKES